MEESTRIANLFKDLYNGSPWLGENFTSTLENISAEKASRKISEDRNSILETVVHIIQWRENVLRRVKGEITDYPENNYIERVKEISEVAWKEVLVNLENSHKKWLEYFSQMKESDWEKIYLGNKMTYYENIHGVLQHDAYHLGQIILLSKML